MEFATIEPMTIQLESAHACVILTLDKDCNGQERIKLYIQAIDAYCYQRELSIQYRHEPGNLDKMFWECHAYRHPGIRCIKTLAPAIAKRLIGRILYLAKNYPSLLFNDAGSGGRAVSEGFVHFHDMLLAGYEPTCKLLK